MTNATIVLVTKFPTKGVSKTRLYSTLGEEATFALAKAMLSDLLNTFSSPQLSTSDVGRKILYIPERSISDAYEFCQSVCPQYENWNICAMDNGLGSATLDLSSSNLTTVLTNALRLFNGDSSVTFIGSDCPQLPHMEWEKGLLYAKMGEAYICPGMLPNMIR